MSPLFSGRVRPERARQIVLIGLGKFGMELLHALQGHEISVLAVDRDEARVQEVADKKLATAALCANALDASAMGSLLTRDASGACEFDAGIVAIGEAIAESIMATMVLKELGVKRVLAKVIDDLHGRVMEKILHLGASGGNDEVVYPYRDTAALVALRLARPSIEEEIALSKTYHFMRVQTPEHFVGKSLAELALRNRYGANVVGIHFAGAQEPVFVLKPDQVLSEGDILQVIIDSGKIADFLGENK